MAIREGIELIELYGMQETRPDNHIKGCGLYSAVDIT